MSGRFNNYPTFRYWLNDESTERLPIPATIPAFTAGSVVETSTTSLTDVILDSMVITPGPGDYVIFFDGTVSNSNNDYQGTISIYHDGVQLPITLRKVSGPKEEQYIGTRALVSGVTAGQTIDVRWNVVNGTGTFHERHLTALKLK